MKYLFIDLPLTEKEIKILASFGITEPRLPLDKSIQKCLIGFEDKVNIPIEFSKYPVQSKDAAIATLEAPEWQITFTEIIETIKTNAALDKEMKAKIAKEKLANESAVSITNNIQ